MTATVLWIIGSITCLVLAAMLWLRLRERREMASWDDSRDGWPDEEGGGMD